MKFEADIDTELYGKLAAQGIRMNTVIREALEAAVEASEASQHLAEGVEPDGSEDAPFATVREFYKGATLHKLLAEARRKNRISFGRRAKITIKPDGRLYHKADGTAIEGPFIVEIRYSKRTS